MKGWNSTMLQISFAKSCKYHATWKALSSKCRRCHVKCEVLSPQCRLRLQNAEHIAHTTQTLLFVSLLFWPWWFRQLSFFLRFAKLYGFLTSWLCLCSPVHRNQRHKRRGVVVCSSSYPNNTPTTATATTKTTATSKATTTRNYYYNYNCSYKYKNYN